MRKWLSGATYALALSGLAAPAKVDAQGWLTRIKDAAKQKADSALNTATGGVAGGAKRGRCTSNNTFQCAREGVVGERTDDAIGGHERELFYRFAVAQPGLMRFTLSPMPNAGSVRMTVTDAQYQELGHFDYDAGQPGTRPLRIAAPGTYYVKLYSWGNVAEPFGLTVRR